MRFLRCSLKQHHGSALRCANGCLVEEALFKIAGLGKLTGQSIQVGWDKEENRRRRTADAVAIQAMEIRTNSATVRHNPLLLASHA